MNITSHRPNLLRGWYTAPILVVLLACLGACNDTRSLNWTEEVLLPDGRVVTLTRHQEFKGPHERGDTPTESDYWFEFKNPDTAEAVRWRSDRDLATLALMFDGAVPMLLTTPNFGGVHRRNCPNPPYLLFRYEKSWSEVPLGTIPVKRVRVNVTAWPKDRRESIRSSNDHLSVEQTQSSEYRGRPYVINFDQMREQTFGNQNCGRTTNDLVE